MKPLVFRDLFALRIVSAAFGTALSLGVSHAASLIWDGNGVIAPNPNGGAGTWDAGATGTWWNGSSNAVWPTSGTNNDAVFDNTAGSVALAAGGITANDVTFNVTGYTITGNTLTLNGTSPTLTAASGVSATISSIVAGTGVVKSGTGTVILGGNNPALSGVTVSQGILQSNVLGSLGTGTVTLGDASSGANSQTLFYNAGNTSAVNVVVAASGIGPAVIKWSQDVLGSNGKTTSSANDLQFTLNRMVTLQCTAGGKQITPFITGGVGAGNTALTISGGTQVTLTAGMNATNTAVSVNNFTGNILVTGNTKLQLQNRAYQTDTAAFWNGAIPDTASVTVDPGSTFALAHGAETIDGLNGGGTVAFDTQQSNGHVLSVGGNNGNGSFTGTMATQGSKANTGLAKVGTGVQELSGTGITYGNATTLTNGTLKLSNTTGWSSNITMDAANAASLQFNTIDAGDTLTFTKLLNGGSSAAKIEKIGPGTLVLNPAAGSSFVGGSANAVTVTGGKVYVNGAFTTAPAVTVASGTLLGGKSTVGATTVASGGWLEGGQAGTGNLTAGSLTFSGLANVACTPSATVAPVVVTNVLATTGGTGSVVIVPSAIPSVDGAYHLLQFGSFSGAAADFRFATVTRALSIQQNGNFIDMVVDNATAGYPIWVGAGSGEWSYASQLANWKLSTTSAETSFLSLDNVVFDDSAGIGSTNIDVSVADLSIGTMTFNNNSLDYTLGGTKDITTGSLVKTGTGKLTITAAYSYAGGSTLVGGTVSVAGETALGTGGRTFNGGNLEYTGVNSTWTRSSTINAGGGTITVSDAAALLSHGGALLGTGTLIKDGPGSLALAQTSGTVANPLVISAGALELNDGGGSATYSGPISGSAGVLRLKGNGTNGTTGLTLTGNNTFTGNTEIYGRRIFLNSSVGSAINGDVVIKQSNWPYHGLSLGRNEQIADTAVLRFEQTDAYDFRLNGKTETLAGIESTTPDGIIENGGYDGGNDADGLPVGLLIVAPAASTSHTFTSGLRDQNNTTGNNKLAFTKAGEGTQVLSGSQITYTGPTSVTGGLLALQNATAFASQTVTVGSGAVLGALGTTTLSGVQSLTIQAGGTLDPDTSAAITGTYVVPLTQSLSGGGTVDGGLNVTGSVKPGDGVGSLTVAGALQMDTGAQMTCQIGGPWATATADSIVCDTFLLTATSANPILITVPASGVTGFTEIAKSLPIIRGTNGGSGFDPAAFVVDAAAFNAATGAAGHWSVAQDGNDIVLVYTAPSSFDGWAASHGLFGADAAPTADPDHDGIPNAIEFVTDSDPSSGGSQHLPKVSVDGANLVIEFTRRDDAGDFNPHIEYSLDMQPGSWVVLDESPLTTTVITNGTDPDMVKMTIPILGAPLPHIFARLKVTIP